MAEIIYRQGHSLYVREWARNIILDIPPEDSFGEAEAIFNFVRDNLRYTQDPTGWEFIQTPEFLLKMIEMGETPMADCDDMTTLGLTLLRTIGFRVGMEVASWTPEGQFEHVYGLVWIDGDWFPFDAIRQSATFGEPPQRQPERTFAVMVKE